MESLEGKHSHLKQHDYRTRVNALVKCAEAADEQDLKLFALQNGGQCFGGKNDENTIGSMDLALNAKVVPL